MEYRRFVLVVDDERMIADTLTTILQRSGFVAAACYSVDDAILILSTVEPDILISDVVMGNRSGVEVAVVARERFPECRIILISGNAATADLLEDAKKTGHNFTCLAKPIHPTELLARLKDSVGTEVCSLGLRKVLHG